MFSFKSRVADEQFAAVAQSVEQGTENPRVGGSIPPGGTKNGTLVKWPNTSVCLTDIREFESLRYR